MSSGSCDNNILAKVFPSKAYILGLFLDIVLRIQDSERCGAFPAKAGFLCAGASGPGGPRGINHPPNMGASYVYHHVYMKGTRSRDPAPGPTNIVGHSRMYNTLVLSSRIVPG